MSSPRPGGSRRSQRLYLYSMLGLLFVAVLLLGSVGSASLSVRAAPLLPTPLPTPCAVSSNLQPYNVSPSGNVTVTPVVWSFQVGLASGAMTASYEYTVTDVVGNVLYDSLPVSASYSQGCTISGSLSSATLYGGVQYSFNVWTTDNSGTVSPVTTTQFIIEYAESPATPSAPTPVPTAGACVNSGGNPIILWPTGVQTSLAPAWAFTYNNASASNMQSFDWNVLDSHGNVIFAHGVQNATITPGCRASGTIPSGYLAAGGIYGIQFKTTAVNGNVSAWVTSYFTESATAGSPVWNPGGGSSSAPYSTVTYACNNPPLIDNSDHKGGIPAIITWIFCQAQHLDLLAPFEGLIDPFIGNLYGWFKNWNLYFGPAGINLGTLVSGQLNFLGNIPVFFNHIDAVEAGLSYVLRIQVYNPISYLFNLLQTNMQSSISGLKSAVLSILSSINSGIGSSIDAVITQMTNIGNSILGTLTGATNGVGSWIVNQLLGPIYAVSSNIINWLIPHPSDFIPLQGVLADIFAREPFHFGITLANEFVDISNTFWAAAGYAGILGHVDTNLGCAPFPTPVVTTPTDAPGLPTPPTSIWSTVTVPPRPGGPDGIPTPIPTDTPLPFYTPTPAPDWPTPSWMPAPDGPTGTDHVHQGLSAPLVAPADVTPSATATPLPPMSGWNGVSCAPVASGNIPTQDGASSGGSLPTVPSLIPDPLGPAGAPAYVANPLTGAPTVASSYGVLGDGIQMFLDLLSHMGISRDNFAKIVDLFIVLATLVSIGRDLGVRAGMFADWTSRD